MQAAAFAGPVSFANAGFTNVLSGGLTAVAAGTVDYWTVASPAAFPVVSGSASPAFRFQVADPQNPAETCWVINTSGSLWTVLRGMEGTVPVAHAPGFSVEQVVTAGAYSGFLQAGNNLAEVSSQPAALANLGLAGYPDQIPSVQCGLQGLAGYTALQVAIANRNNARLDIPVIGDSITEGRGVTAITARYIAQANRAIRTMYPTTAGGSVGGQGFIPLVNTGVVTYTWPIVNATGTWAAAGTMGPVREGVALSSLCTFTWTAPTGTTSVNILHYDFGDAAVWSYKVAAGTAVNVTQNTSNGELVTASIPITSGQLLTIAWVSGYAVVEGIVHYAGDETAGITFHGCGHNGWQAGQVTDINGWNYVPAGGSPLWAKSIANLIPGAGALGINLGAVDSTYYDGPQFQANVLALIALLRGLPALASLPILLFQIYQVEGTWADPNGWPAYLTAIRNVAAQTPNCHVIDLNCRMPSTASNWMGGELYYDTFHPNNLGSALIGEIFAAGVQIT